MAVILYRWIGEALTILMGLSSFLLQRKTLMKKIGIIFSFVFFGYASQNLQAQDYKTALGIRISSVDAVVNHSITFRQFITESFAAEGLLSFSDPGAFGILLESFKPIGGQSFSWFWGAGPYVGFSENYKFGVQGALGLDLKFPSLPVNLSIDWKPELNITKVFSFEPAAVGLSARFVFR